MTQLTKEDEFECVCVKICDETCLNYLTKVVCQENICGAKLCNNSYRPLEMYTFEIKNYEGKGYGLEAKQVIKM